MSPEKASRGFEPRSLDSESRVLTVTPRGQLSGFGVGASGGSGGIWGIRQGWRIWGVRQGLRISSSSQRVDQLTAL